eukprot:4708445-Prymnesium_polylepis.1
MRPTLASSEVAPAGLGWSAAPAAGCSGGTTTRSTTFCCVVAGTTLGRRPGPQRLPARQRQKLRPRPSTLAKVCRCARLLCALCSVVAGIGLACVSLVTRLTA